MKLLGPRARLSRRVPEELLTGQGRWGLPRVPLKGSIRVPLRGLPRVPLKGSIRVPLRGLPGVPLKGSIRVPLRGLPGVPLKGTIRVPLRGLPRVPLRGPTGQGRWVPRDSYLWVPSRDLGFNDLGSASGV